MKGIVIFKGKYGATEQYATWAGSEMQLSVIASHEAGEKEIADKDYLFIGTSVYIGVLVIKEWLKENVQRLKNKKIFLFVVCGTPADEQTKLESYIESSVPVEIKEHCKIYFLPGRLNYRKLSWRDKFILRIGSIFMGKQKSMLAGYDSVKKENIMPLIDDVKEFANSHSLHTVA